MVVRPYSAEEVINIAGSVEIEYTLARNGANRLWNLLQTDSWVAGLGALTGNQAVQEVTGRYESNLFVRLASSGRCQLG
jgi:isocitrate lyase